MTRSQPSLRTRRGARGAVLAASLAAVLGLVAPATRATAVTPGIVLTRVTTLPRAIVMATRPQTGVSYIGTQEGRVYFLRPGQSPKLALDMRSYTRASGERGLLGLAFHPTLNYAYISHTSTAGNSRLVEYSVRADGTLRRYPRRTVLTKTQPFSNHNGGNIAFGPDGYLYMGFGDGGSGGDPRRYSLKLNTWLGKIIRISPRPYRGRAYRVPADNPFVNVRSAKKEIWSLGTRNPWRWSFDPLTHDLWVADVGQGTKEEISVSRAADGRGRGVSFGWSAYEGTDRYNEDQPATGHLAPVYEYDHEVGCSITGGVVYRGTVIPSLYGAYLFADFCADTVWALTLDGGNNPTVTEIATVARPVSFGVDVTGEAYVVSLSDGVFRLDPS